jgi:hypothetical protein
MISKKVGFHLHDLVSMAKKGSEPSKLHDLVHYKKKKEVRRKFLAEGYEMRTMLSANALQRSRGLNFTRITNVIQSRWRISRAFVVIRIIRRRGGIIRRRGVGGGFVCGRRCNRCGVDTGGGRERKTHPRYNIFRQPRK